MDNLLSFGREHSVRDERAEEYFTWKGTRTAVDFLGYVKNVRGTTKLSHSGVLKDAGISGSLARSNPFIQKDLLLIEGQLREKGYLPQTDSLPGVKKQSSSRPVRPDRSVRDRKRIEELEQELATVRLELDDLKEALKRYDLMEQYMSDTMRLPR